MVQRWQVWTDELQEGSKPAIAHWVAGYHAMLPGAGLRLLRECMGRTRAQLAAALGIAERRVARWENCGDDPLAERTVRALFLAHIGDASTFADVCSVLEMTEDWPAWLDINEEGRVVGVGEKRATVAPKKASAAQPPRKPAKRAKKPALRIVGRKAA